MATDPRLRRGLRVLRSTPWLPVAGASAVGGALLLTAAATPTAGYAMFIVVIGLATCGSAAGYLLDEESSAVLDATPTSRSRRTGWRLMALVLPAGVALTGLALLDRADGTGQWEWQKLGPLAAGSLATATALAAVLRRGNSAPGDVAAAVTLTGVLLVVASNPLRHWVSVVPSHDAGVGRSALLWASVVLAAAVVVVRCSRDPVRT
ncbi:MAG: hypothetical protein ABI807_12950 [Sporichthyaceae bacterium]